MAWRSRGESIHTTVEMTSSVHNLHFLQSSNKDLSTPTCMLALHEGFGVPSPQDSSDSSMVSDHCDRFSIQGGMKPGQSAAYVTGCSFLSDCICESTAP